MQCDMPPKKNWNLGRIVNKGSRGRTEARPYKRVRLTQCQYTNYKK